MKFARTLPALLTAFIAIAAIAHPGHDAPPVHAHDWSEALIMAGVIVGIAVVGFGAYALRRARKKQR
ncbi:hypothetical protein BWI17_14305 [Betaproteobacteria bacterium GR16-43]|nr:hypothetical protein BWI17_14305 [Betaproteobacteria bacterium GR16-43]